MPHLDKIFLYPIKSLDGIEVTQAEILPGGALAHDREFAIVDEQGKFVSAKRTAAIHLLRSTFDLTARTVSLWVQNKQEISGADTFHLDDDRADLGQWLSHYFGYPVTIQQNLHMGFPDDSVASGPTVVSTASLQQVADWFPELDLEQIRRRFRPNLAIAAAPAFWEDQWFGETGQEIAFAIGQVQILGSNPCQRCIVPTRDAIMGTGYPDFQKQFMAQRQASLPTWTPASRFNHFYKFTLNTKIPASEAGKQLQVGDQVAD